MAALLTCYLLVTYLIRVSYMNKSLIFNRDRKEKKKNSMSR